MQPAEEATAVEIPRHRRRPKRCASEEKRREAAELFAQGIGYVRASRILDMPANTLKDWAKAWKAGRFSAEISINLYRWDGRMRARVVQLRSTGASWRQITEKTGVSAATARKWVERHEARLAAALEVKPAAPAGSESSRSGFVPDLTEDDGLDADVRRRGGTPA